MAARPADHLTRPAFQTDLSTPTVKALPHAAHRRHFSSPSAVSLCPAPVAVPNLYLINRIELNRCAVGDRARVAASDRPRMIDDRSFGRCVSGRLSPSRGPHRARKRSKLSRVRTPIVQVRRNILPAILFWSCAALRRSSACRMATCTELFTVFMSAMSSCSDLSVDARNRPSSTSFVRPVLSSGSPSPSHASGAPAHVRRTGTPGSSFVHTTCPTSSQPRAAL